LRGKTSGTRDGLDAGDGILNRPQRDALALRLRRRVLPDLRRAQDQHPRRVNCRDDHRKNGHGDHDFNQREGGKVAGDG
jgi:hypothetical protein